MACIRGPLWRRVRAGASGEIGFTTNLQTRVTSLGCELLQSCGVLLCKSQGEELHSASLHRSEILTDF
jgi:hypothetical protein